MPVTHRPYRLLSDHMAVYQFMADIYRRDWRNGVPAPYLEYALCSEWMDKSLVHRNHLWLDGDTIVAFCFYENPVTDIYFSLRPGYEALAGEMLAYADGNMPVMRGKRRLILFRGQNALMDAAAALGYQKASERVDYVLDFAHTLNFPLPAGFSFTPEGALDVGKCLLCCYKGFDHEAEGPFDGSLEGGLSLLAAPHATFERAVAVADARGQYACYAGMWWTEQNRLAYLEPLCTVPEHRGKGLAAAALCEMQRRMKPLGATHMTGGSHPFYKKIGFQPCVAWTFWSKPQPGHQPG